MTEAESEARALPAWPARCTSGSALLLAVAASAFLLSQGLQPSDDAYITFRHAKHLALYGWPAWNLSGPPVLGATSPVWMFSLGLLASGIGAEHIESIALVANAAILFGIVLLSFWIALDLLDQPLAAFLAAALVGFNGVNIYVLSLGFEAGLLVLVVLGSLYALRTDRALGAVLLASAAPLVRPEGLLLSPIVWGVLLLRRTITPRLAATYAALPLAWLIFANAFYGSPVPHSITAKQNFPRIYRPYSAEPVDLIDRLSIAPAATRRMWQGRAQPVLFRGLLVPGQPEDWSVRDNLHWWVALLGLAGLLPALARGGDRALYALYPPLFIALHGWIGTLAIWYLPSFVSLTTLLLFSGCAYGLVLAAQRFRLRTGIVKLGMVCVFALFASANQYAWRGAGPQDAGRGPLYARDARGPIWEKWERERFDGYRRAALRLNQYAADDATALISEVGAFGYFYDGPVLDAVGLCSPEALAFYPPPSWDIFDAQGRPWTTANNFVPTLMIAELDPEYVVNSLTYLENLIRPGAPFTERYEQLAQVGRAWNRPIAIYRRLGSER